MFVIAELPPTSGGRTEDGGITLANANAVMQMIKVDFFMKIWIVNGSYACRICQRNIESYKLQKKCVWHFQID